MTWKSIGIGLAVVLAVAGVVGAAVFMGLGPAPGGSDADDPITDFPTATPHATDSEAATNEVAETAPSSGDSGGPPFSFTIDDIAACGQTCRNVTASLHNNQDEAASGVTVYTRIYAGENTTEPDALVWEGKESVGTIPADQTYTTTRQVELSFQEALQVEQRNGWITVVTTVETESETVTFRDSHQVA